MQKCNYYLRYEINTAANNDDEDDNDGDDVQKNRFFPVVCEMGKKDR